MTDIDVAALRTAAEGATPGPWEPDPDERGASDVISHYPERSLDWNNGDPTGTICQRMWDADAAYIAAANPAVVIELLDRLAAAEGAVARVRSVRALIQMWADEAEKRGPADQINTAGVVAMLAHAIKEQP